MSYRGAVLETEPEGYWRVGEPRGTIAMEESFGLHGLYVGGPTLGVPGLVDDADSAIEFETGRSFTLSGPIAHGGEFSVSCVIALPPADPSFNFVYLMQSGTWAGANSYVLGFGNYDGSYVAKFLVSNGVTYPEAFTPDITGGEGSRHHLVGTYDGLTISVWLDGVKGTDATIVGVVVPPTHFATGFAVQPQPVDEFALWDRVLTPTEIATLAAEMAPSSETIQAGPFVDALGKIIVELRSDSAFATWCGSRVRGEEPAPRTESYDGDVHGAGEYKRFAVVSTLATFREPRVPIQRTTLAINVYGTSPKDAMTGYGLASDALHRRGVRMAGSEPNRLGIWNSYDDSGGTPERDPQTGQPFVTFVVHLNAADQSVAA